MLAILLSWTVILFIFVTLGDLFISSYNKTCSRNETYNLFDQFFISIAPFSILVSVLSIWLPSNHYLLFGFILLSLVYWAVNLPKLRRFCSNVKQKICRLSILEWGIIVLVFSSFVIMSLWLVPNFDSMYYHYQNIHWNEKYSAVYGLANLEDRFGFNSNYLLISAVFSFRFLLGEAIYPFQLLFVLMLMGWILSELVKRKFDAKSTTIFILYFLYILISMNNIMNTSTDVVPNVIIFYLIARLILYPDSLKDSALLYFCLPVVLLTFKISVAPLCLLSLYILVSILRRKEYKSLLFLLIVAVLCVLPWLVRNVIISGYLIYPLPEIDLFSFDWEVPTSVALAQKEYIREYAQWEFVGTMILDRFASNPIATSKMYLLNRYTIMLIYLVVCLSPLSIIYNLIKRRKIHPTYIFIYTALSLYIVYWYLVAPDFRFVGGVMFGLVGLTICLFFSENKSEKNILKKIVVLGLTVLSFLVFGKQMYYYAGYVDLRNDKPQLYSLLIMPYNSQLLVEKMQGWEIEYEPLDIGNGVIIYTTDHESACTFDKLPATSSIVGGLHKKFQDISSIEARGTSLQEGFRAKEGYIVK